MKRVAIGLLSGVLALLLHGCGGNGGVGGGAELAATDRVLVVRVSDARGGTPVQGVEVVVVTATGTVPMQRIVAGQPTNLEREVSLSFARALRSDLRAGDFLLRRGLNDSDIFRGIYVRVPAGYTAVVRHTFPDGRQRVKQMPTALRDQPECLLASNLAGRVETVFGKVGVYDLGTIELFPNAPQVVPPPVDENCP